MRPLPWYVAAALVLWATCCGPSVTAPPDLYRAPAPVLDLSIARPDGSLGARGATCCECEVRVLACEGCEGAWEIPRWCWWPCLECARANGLDVGAFAEQYATAEADADEARCRAGCPLEGAP